MKWNVKSIYFLSSSSDPPGSSFHGGIIRKVQNQIGVTTIYRLEESNRIGSSRRNLTMELTCGNPELQGIRAGKKFSHVSGALNKSKVALILDLIQGNENQILELGCGQGEVTRYLYEVGKNVIGVEKDLRQRL